MFTWTLPFIDTSPLNTALLFAAKSPFIINLFDSNSSPLIPTSLLKDTSVANLMFCPLYVGKKYVVFSPPVVTVLILWVGNPCTGCQMGCCPGCQVGCCPGCQVGCCPGVCVGIAVCIYIIVNNYIYPILILSY